MTSKFFDISIPLDFHGPQPNAFGVERAEANSLGDTRSGSSVNFERYSFTPHCSGTHTECVGHITHERISIRSCLEDIIVPAVLLSLEPERDSPEHYSAKLPGDLHLTASGIDTALARVGIDHRSLLENEALVVRTLPNDPSKMAAVYDERNVPPYFTDEAIEMVMRFGVKHLLVDLPSIDRISDGGILANHRSFWNIPPGSFDADADTRRNATITELIYVPNNVPDGEYQLNLQIAPFEADAAPSRPLLIAK
ncbi:MAG: cyclase family protein [Acidobacteria bacterium]|nr:cyclase family protein [Acidobacteriota bacterium]